MWMENGGVRTDPQPSDAKPQPLVLGAVLRTNLAAFWGSCTALKSTPQIPPLRTQALGLLYPRGSRKDSCSQSYYNTLWFRFVLPTVLSICPQEVFSGQSDEERHRLASSPTLNYAPPQGVSSLKEPMDHCLLQKHPGPFFWGPVKPPVPLLIPGYLPVALTRETSLGWWIPGQKASSLGARSSWLGTEGSTPFLCGFIV